MSFEAGQWVRITDCKEFKATIESTRDSDHKSGEPLYLVNVHPRRLVVRASDMESLEDDAAETVKLKAWTPEWIVEARRLPSALRAALDSPGDLESRAVVFEIAEKLGFIVPI